MFSFFRRLVQKRKCENCADKNLDNSLRCSDSWLPNLIQIVSSLAAVATSIATFCTVKEMRNERDQLYKPQLIFESRQYSNDYEKASWGVWDVRNLIVMIGDEEEYPKLETTIYNIGSGAALDIEINFILDNYKEYVEAITQYYSNSKIDIGDDRFSINYNEIIFDDHVSESDFLTQKPYLLSGETVNVVIPKEFCKLVYYLDYCTNGDYEWQPTVHLQISYSDLQGNYYSTDYELLIKTVVSFSEQEKNAFHVDYYIEQVPYDDRSKLSE